MQPKSLGATLTRNDLLDPDWHKQLNEKQLGAYIRYQYLRLLNDDCDWDGERQRKKLGKWDGGRDSSGTNHSAIWPKLAEAIVKNNAHPAVWVCAHFSPWAEKYIARSEGRFFAYAPSFLKRAHSFTVYAEYCRDIVEHLKQELTTAANTLRHRLKAVSAAIPDVRARTFYVLCDESYVTASPFFRHFFATRFGSTAAVEKYFWRAAVDYEARQHLYDAALKSEPISTVDDQLKEAVLEIRQHWSEYCD